METPGSLESFQALYSNLCALPEQQFLNLDRLGAELDAHAEFFRTLLDKKGKSATSRENLSKGPLDFHGVDYEINQEFRESALQLAEDLDLDEIDAAGLLLQAQDDTKVSNRPIITEAVIRFHQQRKYVLDCLVTILQLSGDTTIPDVVQDGLQSFVNAQILEPFRQSSGFAAKCLSTMVMVKGEGQRLAQKSNTASVTGQLSHSELLERFEYERVSLVKQHESLGVIVHFLVKENHSKQADFDTVLDVVSKMDRYNNFLVHYFPALSGLISHYSSLDHGLVTLADAVKWNDKITNAKAWTLSYVHAAVRVLWTAEYSSCYGENHDGTSGENRGGNEMKKLSETFSAALRDGAFDFLLSLSADVKSVEWCDPARHGLRQWLQRKAPVMVSDSTSFSSLFQEILMEQLETFVESFITNIPDVLRQLRTEEDQQRQLSKDHEHELDLERFIVIISYAFENRAKAAYEGFWVSKDSALYGFLQWASRRASTPLVSAFCEMLQALADGDENATAAHEFLLDEGSQSSGKMRRSHALTWNQIFNELTFFSGKLRGNAAISQSQSYRPGKVQADLAEAEPESTLMLECYLRLITRLCSECSATRQFLFYHNSFNLVELLFTLVNSPIESRLRACAFKTLRSLLTHKSRETGEYLWITLESWVSGTSSIVTSISKTTPSTATTSNMQSILNGITVGFEEPNSFVELLHALVLPYAQEPDLRDALPFPEHIGSMTRMPGIEPYIDCVIGQIFATRSQQVDEANKARLLQLSCLEFIATCLGTFNENLVVFVTESNLSIDAAIPASSLQGYVTLHPFARVMEWMLDEKVVRSILASIHHDPAEVSAMQPDSPLLLCILRGIQVITKIFELEATFLEIIRPVIAQQENSRRTPLTSARFATIEDGILTHLSLFSDLGLLCGTGHPEIVMASLTLLQILSSSPRLVTASTGTYGGVRNRALASIEDDADTISKILNEDMMALIDFHKGASSSEYIIQLQILDFLIVSLKASRGEPSVAHRLLGFKCGRESLSIDPKTSFNEGVSLFHSIVKLALQCPLHDGTGMQSYLVSLNYKCHQVLKELWSSPLSSAIVMSELTSYDVLSSLIVEEISLKSPLLWDGLELNEALYHPESSSSCIEEFLRRRTLLFQYAATELRQMAKTQSPSLKKNLVGILLGSAVVDHGEKVDHNSLFDLFDFLDPELQLVEKPDFGAFRNLDFQICLKRSGNEPQTHSIEKVEELLFLRRAELINSGKIDGAQELQNININAQAILTFFAVDNRLKLLYDSRIQLLGAWVQLALVMTQNSDFDSTSQTNFILRALQTIMPVLENGFDNIPCTSELARLSKALVFAVDFKSENFQKGDMGELLSDRLFHLFQVSLRAVSILGSQTSLKETFYNISYRYLANMTNAMSPGTLRKKHSIQTIKSVGQRFIDGLCDDAHAGTPTCRIAALLLLGALIKLGKSEDSSYIMDGLVRLNFVGLLVDTLRLMPEELRNTSAADVDVQLAYCHAKLALLLQLAQTRAGSTAVLGSGLLHSIKDSELFTVDPDLGVDIEGPDAVTKHYDLLSAILRVICAALLSRGAQNEIALEQGRRFLTDNRLSTMALLKKSVRLEQESSASHDSILELAECFMILINVTGFLDIDENTIKKKTKLTAFT